MLRRLLSDWRAALPPIRALCFLACLLLSACSAAPTGNPRDTRLIPEGSKMQEQCTFLGEFSCAVASMLSADGGLERRAACIAYVEPNGTKVEQCGSVTGVTGKQP